MSVPLCPHTDSSGSWRGGEQGLQEEKGEGSRRKDKMREEGVQPKGDHPSPTPIFRGLPQWVLLSVNVAEPQYPVCLVRTSLDVAMKVVSKREPMVPE